MKNFTKLLFLLSTLSVVSCDSDKRDTPQSNERKYAKVDSLLSVMTKEEKVGQLHLINGFWDVTGPVPKDNNSQEKYNDLKNGKVGAVLNITGKEQVRKIQQLVVENSRLKIPLLFGYDVIHGYKTMMPIPLAESCSWEPELMEKTAKYAALEATNAGINWTFAPMVDISREARWGRVMEGAGEDPYLGSIIAKARVTGFQGDLGSGNTIAACAKHFAGYGFAEAGLEYNSTDISKSTLWNMVLPPFKAANDAGVSTFMNGFNDLSGTPVTGSSYLQRDILKGEWNFDGFVVSDWGSIGELVAHGMAEDKKQAALYGMQAGSDMDMEAFCYTNHLEELLEEDKIGEMYLDDAVRRILQVKVDLGLFENPYKYCDESEKKEEPKESSLDVAYEAALKSMVLLKNDNNLLPLKKEDKIALIGPLASDKNSPLGSWRGKAVDDSAISLEEGLKNKNVNFKNALGVTLITNKRSFIYEVEVNKTDRTGIKEAVALARTVDKVVMTLGEDCFMSGEGRSRTEIGLPGLQLELLKAVHKVNPNIVLVLMNGRPLTLEWENENIPAILETWHLGTRSGDAIASVLYGDYNPSGKLTMSFPRNVGQCPIYYNRKNTGRPTAGGEMVFYAHYQDVEKTALFPFGHGLSYTSFSYSNLTLSQDSISTKDTLNVKITIKNTGSVKGEEVAQLYIRDIASKQTRPIKELKGFKKFALKAGEERTISFELSSNELGYFFDEKFVVEPGTFEVFVGTNSRDVLSSSFKLTE